MFLAVSCHCQLGLAWKKSEGHRTSEPSQTEELWQAKNRGRRGDKKQGVKWNEHKHSTHTQTHTHSDCANPVPVNCSVLESLGRHQRTRAASCSELKIQSRLDAVAWPTRLDQPLIHSLGPGNYWVSTKPHAAASNTQTHMNTEEEGHRNAQHACRLSCHEGGQKSSQRHRIALKATAG